MVAHAARVGRQRPTCLAEIAEDERRFSPEGIGTGFRYAPHGADEGPQQNGDVLKIGLSKHWCAGVANQAHDHVAALLQADPSQRERHFSSAGRT
jgi:hypothetical protein